jgi:hypothetical protein
MHSEGSVGTVRTEIMHCVSFLNADTEFNRKTRAYMRRYSRAQTCRLTSGSEVDGTSEERTGRGQLNALKEIENK